LQKRQAACWLHSTRRLRRGERIACCRREDEPADNGLGQAADEGGDVEHIFKFTGRW
jgi:hypothetical protein